MGTYFWFVQDGEFGTATLNGKGRLHDFVPASIQSHTGRRRADIVELLRLQVDYTPLGRALLATVGGTELSALAVDAVADGAYLFAPGVAAVQTVEPTVEIQTERWTKDDLGPGALDCLNREIESMTFRGEFSADIPLDHWFAESLRDVDLPSEMEVVRAVSRRYEYCGETFRIVEEPVVIGFHERTVALIMENIRAKASLDDVYGTTLRRYKELSAEKRTARHKIRVHLQRMLERIANGLAVRDELTLVLHWLGSRTHTPAPPFLKEWLDDLYGLCNGSALPNLGTEYSSVHGDVIRAVRRLVCVHRKR